MAVRATFGIARLLNLRCLRLEDKNRMTSCGLFLCESKRAKHWDPKWRKLRAAKVLKMDLPDFDKLRRDAGMTPEEWRAEMKRLGRLPPRTFQERDMVISSTNVLLEPYVPPEGEGIATLLSGQGVKQRFTELEKKGKSLNHVRKIRSFDSNFKTDTFPQQALDIYIEAHQLLQDIKKNEDRLHELVTEKAYPEMVWKLELRTFRWKYVESLEAPRVVHVRTQDMLSKENLYAQVTVRFLTRQIMAIYDRFGRLAYGSEHLAKDCLEYVVFEKHISDEYGTWRIHGKIIPDWMSTRGQQIAIRTQRQPNFEPLSEDPGAKKDENKTDAKDRRDDDSKGNQEAQTASMATV